MYYSAKEHLVCGLNHNELNDIVVALYGYQNHNKRKCKENPQFQALLTKVMDAYLLSRDIEHAEWVNEKPDVSKMGVAEAKQFLAYMEQE